MSLMQRMSTHKMRDVSEENRIYLEACKEILTKYIELAIAWSEAEFGEIGFVQLKENFMANLGLARRDESFFERYGDYFLNYYLFIADLKQILVQSKKYHGNTQEFPSIFKQRNIISAFLASARFTAYLRSDPRCKVLHFLREVKFSLFKIEKIAKNFKFIVIKDLFLNTKMIVEPLHDQLFNGFNKGEMIQGFIFSIGGVSMLLKGHICHPSASKPYIEKQLSSYIAKREVPPEAILQQLTKSFQLLSRHHKVPISEVYKTINI